MTPYFRPLALVLLTISLALPPARGLTADNVLRFGIHVSDLGNLDPHFAAGSQDRAVADLLFNGLLRYVPGNAPAIEPDLAVAMPTFYMEKGKQVWRIRLRKGVLFHPAPGLGPQKLTADDVIYSLAKAGDETRSASAGAYAGISFRKLDDYRLELILDHPLSAILFLPKLTNYGGGFILSKTVAEARGYDKFISHPVGTGPFRYQRHDPGTGVFLEANKDYFRGRPVLDGVELRFIPDLTQRETLLRAGDLDIITGSGEEAWIRAMEQEPRIVVDTHGVGEVGSVYLNMTKPPMDDIRVRKAIAYALSRDGFLSVTSPRLSGPVFSQVPAQFLPGGIDEAQAKELNLDYGQNPALARQLLAEAGYGAGFELDLISSEKRIFKETYRSLKAQLERVGIRCNIRVLGHSEMHKAIRSTPPPLIIYFAWRPNADVYLTRFFHSDAMVTSGKKPDTNFSHYGKIDALIEAARLETDPATQISLWTQAQIRILDDMAAFPVMFTMQCYARTADLHYGHPLISTMALYPQFTEKTRLTRKPSP